jgi:hypothetical protein
VVSIKDNNLEERVRPGPMLYTFDHHGSGKGVITIKNEVEVCRIELGEKNYLLVKNSTLKSLAIRVKRKGVCSKEKQSNSLKTHFVTQAQTSINVDP